MDAQPALSPIRQWIVGEMKKLLPTEVSEIRSDNNEILFKEWTGMTQSALENIWVAEDTQRAINNIASGKGDSINLLKFKKRAAYTMHRAKDIIAARRKSHEEALLVSSGGGAFNINSLIKSVGTTTTCNAFLGVVVRKALEAGGLARRTFHSFDLPKAGGTAWTWQPSADKLPKPGDFYQVGKKGGMYEHVGIIIDINGENWSTADSGQGGPGSGYDAIKRKTKISYSIMGWIDVDMFFDGWKGKD